jgi:hypothetical protein
MVVDALGPPSGLNGVTRVAVKPKTAPDRRCRGSASLPVLSMLEGGGFGPCADGAPSCPRSERWRKAELSACCAAAASSNAFSCWRTRLSSEVTAAARFCDARRKTGGTSALASTFTPSLVRRLLSRADPRAGGVGVRSCGCSAAGQCSRRSPFPSGAPPAQVCLVQAVDRGARHPCPALGEEGPAPRRASALPPRVRRAAPVAGRRRHGGAEPTPVRSCLKRRPHRHCTLAWDHVVAWSMPSESS